MKAKINIIKPVLIVGLAILTISLCIILPLEYSNATLLSDLGYTFLGLTLAILTIMYGLMGKHFFKGLLFLFFSIICGMVCWQLLFPHPDVDKPTFKSLEILLIILLAFANIANIFMGIVTGVVSGLIFLVVNFCFLRDENRYKLFFKRLVSYLLILLIFSILFAKGGDWIFELTEYFKNKG